MSTQDEDPYLWLEDVTGETALAWVRALNQKSQAELEAMPMFAPLRTRLLAMLNSKEKIPWASKLGAHYYNFWRDESHTRGIWRRATPTEYRKPQPAWKTVLDLDILSSRENENWVWGGAATLYPKRERCLITLSRGGSDAAVVREFDLTTCAFVDGGFVLPEAKSSLTWKDLDTVYVATDFGPGSMTDSGYPRIVKEWQRGTPLTDAKIVYEGQTTDVNISAGRYWDHGRARDFVSRAITFYTSESFIRDAQTGALTKVDVPIDAEVDTWDDQLLVKLRSDWTVDGKTWPSGAFLAIDFDAFFAGARQFTMLFTPAANKSFAGSANLKSALVVNELEDVHNRIYVWTLTDGKWTCEPMLSTGLGSYSLSPMEPGDSDEYWYTATDFLTPTTLSIGALGEPPVAIKSSPTYFNADGLTVEQHFAKSADGTRVPYFQVAKTGLVLDGNNATLLYGYGGFEVSLEPAYSGFSGAGWLERGGVYVQANIRGGGEYGPAWHQAALKHSRQRAYDDFIAIAEDLIARRVTSPPKLAIEGGSNGGLLVGVMLTQRPELFGAVVCEVPLLDMRRYHKLLAGASWMAEYGDPDNADDWAAIAKYSPYQNLRAGVKYPRTLFATSTRDDRVHPGHARKMVARMNELGADLLYYENIEGGHGGAANNEQRAHLSALTYAFLAKQLGL